MKLLIILALSLGLSWRASGQENSVTGFLVLSFQIDEHTTFDFFIVAEIDTTKSFEENILQLKHDTLRRVSAGELPIDRAFFISNEVDSNKLITILPVKVILGDWIMYDMFLHKESFVKFPVRVFNQIIISGLDAHSVRSFEKVRILQLSD